MNENILLTDIAKREELIDRVEILDKVKTLLLMPEMTFTTVKGVASYYEVGIEAIKSIIKRNRKELEEDGLCLLKKKDFLEIFYKVQAGPYKLENTRASVTLVCDNGNDYTFTNKGSYIFNKRTILRIGMLLEDSEVAKEVRTQLLNIEENSSDEIKVKEINTELDLLGQALTASFLDNDIEAFAKVSMKLNQYINRHKDTTIKTLRSEVKELNASLDKAMFELNELKVLNSALSVDLTQVASSESCRRAVVSMMKRLTVKRNFNSEWLCWKEFYILLRDKHDINLSARKYSGTTSKNNTPMIDYITDEEWPQVLSIATALCHRFDVEISDLLLDLEKNEVA